MMFQQAGAGEFAAVREFYWDLIGQMKDQNDKIGWKKGIYIRRTSSCGKASRAGSCTR